MSDIDQRLSELKQLGLYRRLRLVSGPQGPNVLLDGKPILLLCSNNYLGLANHPQVREAAADAAMRWGVGAGASRLVSGTMTIHRRLEEHLAAFEGTEACVLFGSGYLANIGVLGALAGPGDVIFSDRLNHASIVDGCRASRARTFVYQHCDPEHLEWGLHQARDEHAGGRRVIVTDTVFSMDGDVAPLVEIVEAAARHGARVVVDEAHATGVLGPGGRGAVAEAGLEGQVDVVIGTLGKSLGSYGAYACADTAMVRYLINTARSLIFSTAPGPPAVAAALAALELLQRDPRRVTRACAHAALLRERLAAEGLACPPGDTAIVPLIVGEADEAVRMCEEALERGVFAQAIRPPTVAPGTSRLRLAVMASHTQAELTTAAQALAGAARAVGGRAPAAAATAAGAVAAARGDDQRDQRDQREERGSRASGSGWMSDVDAFLVGAAGRTGGSVRLRATGARSARSLSNLRGCLVTGTDTGAGKTVVAASITAALAAAGEPVRACKPVLTGIDQQVGEWLHDHELLALAAGMDPLEVAPLRFGPAVSPHLAAALAGVAIDPRMLVANTRREGESGAAVIVEGLGGLLVPITNDYSVCDLAVDLGLPVVIAARPGLGTINHSLLTIACARAAGLDVRAVVLTPWPASPDTMQQSNRETIARLGDVEVAALHAVGAPRRELLARAGAALPYQRWIGEAHPSGG